MYVACRAPVQEPCPSCLFLLEELLYFIDYFLLTKFLTAIVDVSNIVKFNIINIIITGCMVDRYTLHISTLS